MSTKKKYGDDSRAKAAAECYIALESAQASISILIGVPDSMRAARYTTNESKDKTLQVQVRCEVERIKRDNVDPEQDWKQQHHHTTAITCHHLLLLLHTTAILPPKYVQPTLFCQKPCTNW
jgi:hypothetical protein